MKIFIIEDDMNVVLILKKIIQDKELGDVIGFSNDGIQGFENLIDYKPDIAILDLLMPKKDGITLIREAKDHCPNTKFIMLSQVASKDMIQKAYESGIEYYISKPVNAVEVENVIRNTAKSIKANKTLSRIQNIFNNFETNQINYLTNNESQRTDETLPKIKEVMNKIGIMGESGCNDIIKIIEYLIKNDQSMSDYTIRELCAKFSDSPKSMEQRIRRTAYTGMVNLANLGIEDYMNEIFVEYSNGLYNFEQVRKEMDYIRGKNLRGGKINLKKFIDGMMFYCNMRNFE